MWLSVAKDTAQMREGFILLTLHGEVFFFVAFCFQTGRDSTIGVAGLMHYQGERVPDSQASP